MSFAPLQAELRRFAPYSATGSPAPRVAAHGVVLAGTYPWGETVFERRLRGPLLPVALEPLISYPLAWLRSGGVCAATVCASPWTAAVRRTLRDGSLLGMTLGYHDDQTPRGAAGCVRDAVVATDEETIVVVEGALVPSLDLHELLASHHASGAVMTVVTEIDRRRSPLSRVRLPSPGGVYVFARCALREVPARGFHDIKEGLLERLYRTGQRVSTYEVPGIAPRVIDVAAYMGVNRWLTERNVRVAARHGYERRGEALCHESSRIGREVQFVGPALVAASVVIEGDAVIVGPTVIGPGSRVDGGAVIARSVLWSRCRIGTSAVVDDSLLTDDARVPPGEELTSTIADRDRARRRHRPTATA